MVLDNCEHLLGRGGVTGREAMLRAAPGGAGVGDEPGGPRRLPVSGWWRVRSLTSLASAPTSRRSQRVMRCACSWSGAQRDRAEFRLDAGNADAVVRDLSPAGWHPAGGRVGGGAGDEHGPGRDRRAVGSSGSGCLTGGRRRGGGAPSDAAGDGRLVVFDCSTTRAAGVRPSRRVRGELRRRRGDRGRWRRRVSAWDVRDALDELGGQVDGRPRRQSGRRHAVSDAGDVAPVRTGATRRGRSGRGVSSPARRVLRHGSRRSRAGHGGP